MTIWRALVERAAHGGFAAVFQRLGTESDDGAPIATTLYCGAEDSYMEARLSLANFAATIGLAPSCDWTRDPVSGGELRIYHEHRRATPERSRGALLPSEPASGAQGDPAPTSLCVHESRGLGHLSEHP